MGLSEAILFMNLLFQVATVCIQAKLKKLYLPDFLNVQIH